MALLSSQAAGKRKRLLVGFVALVFVGLVTLGIFGKNGWLPSTDPMTGKKTGWFGKALPNNASSSWNPLAAPLPSPTPQLSKEYIYAGSRLLAVEDANASAAPPADLAVWRPSSGEWKVLGGPGSAQTSFYWGGGWIGDIPAPGDFDGDGKTDFSVFRQSSAADWCVLRSSDGSYFCSQWGIGTDKPAQADYDGDGKTDLAVKRAGSSNAEWYVVRSDGGGTGTFIYWWGIPSDVPAPADYDGDGRADITVWRNGDTTFYTLLSTTDYNAYESININQSGTPVSADYDGDGKADYAVRNGATWHIRKSSDLTTYTVTPTGDLATDIPVHNDYDGDGKCDIAVWRPANSSGQTDAGNWYIRQSATNTLRTAQWGAAGDIPVPAFYRR